jgi:hypothetical protein
MVEQFLDPVDAKRVSQTLRRLAGHDLSRWAIAGGLAVEIHQLQAGRRGSVRALNDLDIVATSFDCIPETLAQDFLFRHVHPLDPPGKIILQFVDPATALRVDVFRAYGNIMDRTVTADLPTGRVRVVSLEDAVARAARVLLDLDSGVPLSRKHAEDYVRLAELAGSRDVETAWRDHRKPKHPLTFRDAAALLEELMAVRGDLLITPAYSKDSAAVCTRCANHHLFPLANASEILSLLGYC